MPRFLEVKHYEYNLQIGENNLLTIITTSISNTLAYNIKLSHCINKCSNGYLYWFGCLGQGRGGLTNEHFI